MSVRFGGDIASYVVDAVNRPMPNTQFTVYKDPTLLIPATGLTTVTGSAITAPITDAAGFFQFNAPDGTAVLYVGNGTGGYAMLLPRPKLLADGVTDNGDLLNATTGRLDVSPGTMMARRCVNFAPFTSLRGVLANNTSTGVGSTLKFDPNYLMAAGTNAVTVVANGTTWTITLPTGHGLRPGDSISTIGFTNAGFNQIQGLLIYDVTSTTLVVLNNNLSGASDSGRILPWLIRLGAYNAYSQAVGLRDMTIGCSLIPGGIAIGSTSLQEQSGVYGVSTYGALGGGLLIGNSVGSGITLPLNYDIDSYRNVTGDNPDPGYVAARFFGGNVSQRGVRRLTLVGGTSGGGQVTTQMTVDGYTGGIFEEIHVEGATDGVIVGAAQGCKAVRFSLITGGSSVTNLIRIARPLAGTTGQLVFTELNPNGTTGNTITDQTNGTTLTGPVGRYSTDTDGNARHTTKDSGVVTATLGTDVAITAATSTTVLTVTVPVGSWVISHRTLASLNAGVTQAYTWVAVTPGAAPPTGTVAAQANLDDAGGVQHNPQNTAAASLLTMASGALLTVLGSPATLTLNMRTTGANGTAKASTVGLSLTGPTKLTATRVGG